MKWNGFILKPGSLPNILFYTAMHRAFYRLSSPTILFSRKRSTQKQNRIYCGLSCFGTTDFLLDVGHLCEIRFSFYFLQPLYLDSIFRA